MREILQKTQVESAVVKDVCILHVYKEKQWKNSTVKCKNM